MAEICSRVADAISFAARMVRKLPDFQGKEGEGWEGHGETKRLHGGFLKWWVSPHGSCVCPAGHRSFPGGFVKSVRVLCVLGGFGRLKFPAEDRNIICTIILLRDVSKGMFQVVIPLIL